MPEEADAWSQTWAETQTAKTKKLCITQHVKVHQWNDPFN